MSRPHHKCEMREYHSSFSGNTEESLTSTFASNAIVFSSNILQCFQNFITFIKYPEKTQRIVLTRSVKFILGSRHYKLIIVKKRTSTKTQQQKPPGLVAQVVPSSSSNLQLGGSIPRINNYPAKKKKKKKCIQQLFTCIEKLFICGQLGYY